MTFHLETDRMVLRHFSPHDLNHLTSLDSDPDVIQHINGGSPLDEADEKGFLELIISRYSTQPHFGFFAAVEKPTLEFIGWFHFRPDRHQPEFMEIGYRLQKLVWGRGLATEGSRALIHRGLSKGVRRISGRTMKANFASIRVLEKLELGFVHEYQEVKFPGKDKTAVLYQRIIE